MKPKLKSISLVLSACLLLIGFTASLSSFGRGGNAFSSNFDTGSGTGTDTGGEKKYWKDDPSSCTVTEMVPKPGGGYESKDFPGVKNICVKVQEEATCNHYDCTKID